MRDKLFKLLFDLGIANALRHLKKDSITVVALHRISDERDYFFDPIKPNTFRQLLEYLNTHYEITNFNSIKKASNKPKLILSFDDGYKDFIETALPILTQMGLPSNHNVVNACINSNQLIWTQKLNNLFNFLKDQNITTDSLISNYSVFNGNWNSYYMFFFQHLLQCNSADRNFLLDQLFSSYNVSHTQSMMTWDDLLTCSKKDVEIGCHTYNHDALNTLHYRDYDLEIRLAIEELNIRLKQTTTILSLPNGQFNNSVIDYAFNMGMKFILLSDDKLNRKSTPSDKEMVSRILLNDASIYEVILKTELFHSKLKTLK